MRELWLKSVEGRSNRGSKVIGDHFENLFSIYRRDFLKMIADHFSSTDRCSISTTCHFVRPTLGQFNLGLHRTFEPLTFNVDWDSRSENSRQVGCEVKGRSIEQGVEIDRRSF
jgi:hypothetical protein